MSGRLRNLADLDQAAAAGRAAIRPPKLKILVGSASCGVAVGARTIEAAARRAVEELGLDAVVCRTGCIGFCAQEPLVDLVLPGGPRLSYGRMTVDKTRQLLAAYKAGDLLPDRALGRMQSEEIVSTGQTEQYPGDCPDFRGHPRAPSGHPLAGGDGRQGRENGTVPFAAQISAIPEWSSLDFYRRQKKVIQRNCGAIDPMSLEETIARGTYRGALAAMTGRGPEAVIDEVSRSGLRGRGGAAFPTGQKWQLARQTPADQKYVVCNADEGEPGSYMDRTVLEGDPHAVLEGMLLGAYAIGASQGFIYVRNEYPLAIEILEHAIAQAEDRGLLGDDIFGSGCSFRVTVRRGAGAYICGEETALIESLEGHSGEPRTRPPYPVTRGLWGKPTVVNNVKTWASVPPILTRGAAWYAGMGTKRTPGTTIFSLEGAVRNAGLVEVPFGITLRDLVCEIGGGVTGNRPLKAIQAGGASRGCIGPAMLDLAIDTEDRPGQSILIGTGGVIVLDDTACMVDMARFLVGFFLEESCGKCVPCREGVKQMSRLLGRIAAGRAGDGDLALLERLARTVRSAAVCGMGGMAPGAVLATLEHFRGEFEAHVHDRRCPAGVCEMSPAAAPEMDHEAATVGRAMTK
jgi:NADH:ubiquinone oxidoreductase subunit F (NADH-binding)/(2Fe-2S) ferredoxin